MTNENLLKEAIADAKAVKETAIANAKLALEEAFTPHLKSMLSAKLEEMDKEDEDVNESEEEVKEMDASSFRRKNSPAGDTLKDLTPQKVGTSTVQEDADEINLDELLAELELDENERTDAEEEGYKDGMRDEEEDIEDMEDEEIDLEDLSEDDLKSFIEDVIKDLIADGTIEAGDEFENEEEIEDVEDVDIEVEIDEMTKKEKAEGDDRKKDDEVEAETEKMRFKEALDEINALRVEVSEVNLLNAKLLYTNKIFKEKNLSEGKKVKVLKAFDKATTVKEAKVIFETLNEGITSSRSTPMVNEIKGRASKATGIISEAKKPIIESNAVYDRMRKLAGLI